MRTLLQILFGLALAAGGAGVCLYLGLLVRGAGPGWLSGLILLLLAVVGQWLSFWVFRHGIALQVCSGLALCAAIGVSLTYSGVSFFWEAQYPDKSNPITWRSGVLLLALIAVTQLVAVLVFRLGRPRPNRGST
jgi:hypothetical protein